MSLSLLLQSVGLTSPSDEPFDATKTPPLKIKLDHGPKPMHRRGTLIFLHGWPDNSGLWTEQISSLKNSYRCIALDLPGFGMSSNEVLEDPMPKWGYTPCEIAEILNLTIKDLDVGKVTIVSNGWGSIIAHKAIELQPALYNGYVSFDVGPFTEKHTGESQGENDLPFLMLLAMFVYQSINIALFVMSLVPGLYGLASFITELYVPLLMKVTARKQGNAGSGDVCKVNPRMQYLYFYLRVTKDFAFVKQYSSLPCLFFAGAETPFHTEGFRKFCEQQKNSKFIKMDGENKAGHWIMLDRPEFVAKAMRRFLSRLGMNQDDEQKNSPTYLGQLFGVH